MARISTHLDEKNYSVAMTDDPSQPLRKWDWHRGSTWAKSALSAAFNFGNVIGAHQLDHSFRLGIHHGEVYRLEGGKYLYVSQPSSI
jgi:hypothetical protein